MIVLLTVLGGVVLTLLGALYRHRRDKDAGEFEVSCGKVLPASFGVAVAVAAAVLAGWFIVRVALDPAGERAFSPFLIPSAHASEILAAFAVGALTLLLDAVRAYRRALTGP